MLEINQRSRELDPPGDTPSTFRRTWPPAHAGMQLLLAFWRNHHTVILLSKTGITLYAGGSVKFLYGITITGDIDDANLSSHRRRNIWFSAHLRVTTAQLRTYAVPKHNGH